MVAVIEGFPFRAGHRVGLKGGIGNRQVLPGGFQQGDQGIEPGAEAHFKQGDFAPGETAKPVLDKNMVSLLQGPVQGMVLFLPRGQLQGQGAICRPYDAPLHLTG